MASLTGSDGREASGPVADEWVEEVSSYMNVVVSHLLQGKCLGEILDTIRIVVSEQAAAREMPSATQISEVLDLMVALLERYFQAAGLA